MFYLGVAYAANIGGTGTLTASEPNVIMKGILDEKFPCQVTNLDPEMLSPYVWAKCHHEKGNLDK